MDDEGDYMFKYILRLKVVLERKPQTGIRILLLGLIRNSDYPIPSKWPRICWKSIGMECICRHLIYLLYTKIEIQGIDPGSFCTS